jgi:hypothetical protein
MRLLRIISIIRTISAFLILVLSLVGLAVQFGLILNTQFITKIFIFFSGIAIIQFAASAIHNAIGKQLEIKSVIQSSLDISVLLLKRDHKVNVRSCVFLLSTGVKSRSDQKMKIKYNSSNMDGHNDLSITIEKWQGCAGQSWGEEQIVVADLTLEEVLGGATWHLTSEQVDLTSNLKTIIAVPIMERVGEKKLIGILSFDSEDAVIPTFLCGRFQADTEIKAIQIAALLQSYNIPKSNLANAIPGV